MGAPCGGKLAEALAEAVRCRCHGLARGVFHAGGVAQLVRAGES
jgi:hypothetical protein